MNNLVKFAVVGCGNIGSRHLAVLHAQPQAKIVGICDIDADKCRNFSAQYDDVPYYTDYTLMLSRTDADVINICTPHGLHAAMAIEAARSGKHILVEKPMALRISDCEAMIDAARSNGVQLMVVKQNRYNVPIALTKQALDANSLGRIYMVQCNVLWNRNESYYRNSTWRGSKELEGGSLYTQVSHFIDLMIWWFGDIVAAQTHIETMGHDIEIEDCGCSNLTFATGVVGSLLWTTCVYNKNYEGSITVVGQRGTIKIGGQYLNKIEFWDVQSCPLPEDVQFVDKPNLYGKYQGTSSNHDKVMNDVVGDLLHERRHTVQGDEGLRTIRAIELLYCSTPLCRE